MQPIATVGKAPFQPSPPEMLQIAGRWVRTDIYCIVERPGRTTKDQSAPTVGVLLQLACGLGIIEFVDVRAVIGVGLSGGHGTSLWGEWIL